MIATIRAATLDWQAADGVEWQNADLTRILALARREGLPVSPAAFTNLCDYLSKQLRGSAEANEDFPAGEAVAFLRELGVEESGVGALIRSTYHLLGLRTYFTAGEKEIRAWTIRRGATAPEAGLEDRFQLVLPHPRPRGAHHVGVVLHHQDGVACLDQPPQDSNQPGDIHQVLPYRWLVQDIQGFSGCRSGEFRRTTARRSE